MGKSQSQSCRKKQRNKKNRSAKSEKVFNYAPTAEAYAAFGVSLSFGHIYIPPPPQLCPRYPEQRETLSLDDGFDQTRVLKDILGHYKDLKPSPENIASELSYLVFKQVSSNTKNLEAVYSSIAPSVVSVSSFYGVARKIDCSGLIIHWSSTENEATILTSAKLLWSPKDSAVESHLIVRMVDGTLLLGKEDHVDYYHNLLTLKVKSTVELKVVDLSSRQADIVEGMNVISLGRSFYTYSLCDSIGKLFQQHPLFGCDELLSSNCCVSEICEGGPLITDTGYVIGINFFGSGSCAHPLPTPIILSCLEMWRSFNTVVRPWFGMSVIDMNQLSYQVLEKLNISPEESHVVVRQVYEGSLADKNNVRSYDSVATLDGTLIRSAKQYSQLSSEKSRASTSCGDSGQRFTVIIRPCDRRAGNISIEADYVSVDDKRLCDCWPRVEADEWSRMKYGSQKKMILRWPPSPE